MMYISKVVDPSSSVTVESCHSSKNTLYILHTTQNSCRSEKPYNTLNITIVFALGVVVCPLEVVDLTVMVVVITVVQ